MKRSKTIGAYPRLHVRWPVLYRGEDFLAEGTMVDLSIEGGRLAGTMPVAVGMRLGLFIDCPEKSADLIVDEAVVTWVKGNEFGAQFLKIGSDDRQWLRQHLELGELDAVLVSGPSAR